jgi:hypothetical protein
MSIEKTAIAKSHKHQHNAGPPNTFHGLPPDLHLNTFALSVRRFKEARTALGFQVEDFCCREPFTLSQATETAITSIAHTLRPSRINPLLEKANRECRTLVQEPLKAVKNATDKVTAAADLVHIFTLRPAKVDTGALNAAAQELEKALQRFEKFYAQ